MSRLKYKSIERVNKLVVHCADTKPSMTHVDWDWVDNLHRTERRFRMGGYHYFIKRDGLLQEGRPDDMPGAHAAGHNLDSLGICLAGGQAQNSKRAENNFTPEQFDTLEALLIQLTYLHPTALILGHRDLPGVSKACPSFDVTEWWAARKALRQEKHDV